MLAGYHIGSSGWGQAYDPVPTPPLARSGACSCAPGGTTSSFSTRIPISLLLVTIPGVVPGVRLSPRGPKKSLAKVFFHHELASRGGQLAQPPRRTLLRAGSLDESRTRHNWHKHLRLAILAVFFAGCLWLCRLLRSVPYQPRLLAQSLHTPPNLSSTSV